MIPTFQSIVEEHWTDPPDWLLALAAEADRTSQAKAGGKIGYTSSALSSLFRNRYKAGTTAIEECVRGALMKATITCPVLGEIGTHECASWRAKAKDIVPSSSHRVRMARACNNCPKFSHEEKTDE